MKTPEQIAHQIYREGITLPANPNGADLRALMVRAIEADRAQRALVDAEHREGVILSAPKGWRVWCPTPKDVYDQVRDLTKIGYDITELTWEPA